jgi:HEAT repeat protein
MFEATGAEGLRVLRELATADPDAVVRRGAVSALGRLGSRLPVADAGAAAAADIFRVASEDSSEVVRGAALEALGEMRSPLVLALADEWLESGLAARLQMVRALAKLSPDEARPFLARAVGDANALVARRALKGLLRGRDPASVEVARAAASAVGGLRGRRLRRITERQS